MTKRLVKDFLYPDLTYKIRGAMYKVHKTLGSGHKESVYHKALAKEFELQKITYETEKTLPVVYEGVKVGNYKPDFVVDNKVLVELKAVPFLSIQAERQLSYYLKGTSYKLGLLVNFGDNSLFIKRMVWDKARQRQHNQPKSAKSA
jgi:GxxExxY protein